MTTNTPAHAAGNALASIQGLKGALQTVRQNIHTKGGKPFLKMDKGIWTYGQENIEVEDGSLWAINPLSIMVGWVCWKVIPPGNPNKEKPENLGEEMVPLGQTPPAKHTLPDLGYPWAEQVSFDLVCVSGEDKGEEVTYKTSSNGGKSASDDIIKALLAQIDKDANNAVPVVELKSDSYANKTYGGRTFYPIFEIKKWVPMDVMPEEPEEGDEPEAEQSAPEPAAAAPAGRRRGAAPAPAPEPEPETVAAAPEQRRRRRG